MTVAVTKPREDNIDGKRTWAPDSFLDEVVADAVVDSAAADSVPVEGVVVVVLTVSPEEECELDVVTVDSVAGASSETELVVSIMTAEVEMGEFREVIVVCVVDVLRTVDWEVEEDLELVPVVVEDAALDDVVHPDLEPKPIQYH